MSAPDSNSPLMLLTPRKLSPAARSISSLRFCRPLTPTPSRRFSPRSLKRRRSLARSFVSRRRRRRDAKAIVAPILRAAVAADCALLIENDGRLAARLGADGVHVNGAGADLVAAVESLKPERIVGAGFLRTRDEAMTAGEIGGGLRDVRGAAPRRAGDGRSSRWPNASAGGPKSLKRRASPMPTQSPPRACWPTPGADFVALGDAIWGRPSPSEAAREAQALLAAVSSEGSMRRGSRLPWRWPSVPPAPLSAQTQAPNVDFAVRHPLRPCVAHLDCRPRCRRGRMERRRIWPSAPISAAISSTLCSRLNGALTPIPRTRRR